MFSDCKCDSISKLDHTRGRLNKDEAVHLFAHMKRAQHLTFPDIPQNNNSRTVGMQETLTAMIEDGAEKDHGQTARFQRSQE
jgi:hypothetical protein